MSLNRLGSLLTFALVTLMSCPQFASAAYSSNGKCLGTVRSSARSASYHLVLSQQRVELKEYQDLIDGGTAYEQTLAQEAFIENSQLIEIAQDGSALRFAHWFQGVSANGPPRSGNPVTLSMENGLQPLDLVRIVFTGSGPDSWTQKHLVDYLLAMQRVPGFGLLVQTNNSKRDEALKLISQQPIDVRRRVRLASSEDSIYLNPWAQDGSKPVNEPRTILYSGLPDYRGNLSEIKRANDLRVIDHRPRDLVFQGGDIIVGSRNIFVGASTLESAMSVFSLDERGALDEISRIFGKPAIAVGIPSASGRTLNEWSFHIDLDMVVASSPIPSRLGTETVLVNSTRALFAALLGNRRVTHGIPSIFELKNMINSYLTALRRRLDSGEILKPGELKLAAFFARWTTSRLREEWIKSDIFSQVVRANGYKVEALPGVGIYDGTSTDDLNAFLGTNAVLSGRYALVPSNDHPALDQSIKSVYSSLGFEVIPMRAATESLPLQGATRCASETCRRAYEPAFWDNR